MKLKVKKTIEKYQMINKGDSVLLAMSGGPDSLCLFEILNSLKEELSFSLYVLHVNHMIRSEADDDASFIENYCEEKNVPCYIIKEDIPALSKKRGISEEECGRDVRYEALFKKAKEIGNCKIALAHNKNDQAETVLMRILRGTGVHGLCSMEYVRDDGIIRPLLDIERSEIEEYIKENNLSPRIDKTNEESVYFRNKIRLKLLPMLKEYNPNIIEALVRLSLSAKEDDKALLDIADEYEDILDCKVLSSLSPAVFKRVIVNAFKKEGLAEDISRVHLDSLKDAIDKNVGGKTIEFPHGYKAYIKNGKVNILK